MARITDRVSHNCNHQEVLGVETFNADVKAAVAEAYFFLADIFIR